MAIHRSEVLRFLSISSRPMGVRELLHQAGFHPGQQTDLKRVLRELVRAGQVRKSGKRYVIARQSEADDEHARGDGRRHPGKRSRTARPQRSAVRADPRRSQRDDASPPRVRDQRRGREEKPAGRARRPIEAMQEGQVEGILHLHRDGYGFVHPLHGDGENIFLPVQEASRALDGDRVRVEIVEGRGGRTAGALLEVVSRVRQRAVGVYQQHGRRAWVTPNDHLLPGDIAVPPTQMARNGDLVKVTLGIGASVLDGESPLFGEVTGSLGEPGTPSAEVLSIAYAQGFSDEFPDDAMAEADAFPTRVPAEDTLADGRRDLRDIPLVTIDGVDARDFDDAVFAEKTVEGWRLIVAIADVAHYVRPQTALDAEALRRGTSVYLPDRVLPMLPERLSNGICSLRPDEDRLCMVADLVLGHDGRTRRYELYQGVMRSAARCTYDEVQDVLDGKPVPHRSAFRSHFETLMALARALHGMRMGRGAIDFDLPEHKIILDEEGLPVRLDKRDRKDSHRLIEECMLAANEAVAIYFRKLELPSVYRFHAEPDEEKLSVFAGLARAHGFELGTRGEISSHDLNQFLAKLEGHPESRALNQLLLRSMMQAVYSAENVGHYGLGAEHYLHFTSPIRRYPDLLVHRLLKEHWSRGGRVPPSHERERQESTLEELAVQCSERERAAVAVEREVVAFYTTILMKDRVGEEFSATVSSLADFGFFVEIDELFVEGLVRAETIGSGFRYDPLLYALTWPDGRKVKVGDRAKVRLISANVARRQLEFQALELNEAAVSAPTEADQQHEKWRRDRGAPPPERTSRRSKTERQPVAEERPGRFKHPSRETILRGSARKQGSGARKSSGQSRATVRRTEKTGDRERGGRGRPKRRR